MAEADLLACRFNWNALHTGDFNGIPASGRKVDFEVQLIDRIRDGRIDERHVLFGLAGFIGLLTAAKAVYAATARRPKASDGNPANVGAPIPGSVASAAVTVGQKVKPGDLLLTIEAMKMETGIHADRDGVVKAVHVTPGSQVDAKDLLVEFG